MAEEQEQTGSWAMERDRAQEVKWVTDGLRWVACLPPRIMLTSKPRMLPRARSGSMIQPKPQSLLISMPYVAT